MKTDLFKKKEPRNYKPVSGSQDETSDFKTAKVGASEGGPEGAKSVSVGDGSAASTSYSGTPGRGSDLGHKAPLTTFTGAEGSTNYGEGNDKPAGPGGDIPEEK